MRWGGLIPAGLGAAIALAACSLVHDTDKLVSPGPDASSAAGGEGAVGSTTAGGLGGGGGAASSVGGVAGGGGAATECDPPACPQDHVCLEGTCKPCGQLGQDCCDNSTKFCDAPSTRCCVPGDATCALMEPAGTTCMYCCMQCQDHGWEIVPIGVNDQNCHDVAKNKCNSYKCGPQNNQVCGLNEACWSGLTCEAGACPP